MRRGYWKNGGRETLCVHPCSLASLHFSSSLSLSVSLPLFFHPPLSLRLSHSLSLSLPSCLFLFHISHQCPLWSNWASHKSLQPCALSQLCRWHCINVCCSHVTIWIISACLQGSTQVNMRRWCFSLKKCWDPGIVWWRDGCLELRRLVPPLSSV